MAGNNPVYRLWIRLTESIRRVFGRNIATIVFSLLLLYMAVSAVFYMTTSHIESYEVITGPLSMNETYTGLVLREETVMKAESSGYVNYYAREGDKINANGAVYGLSSTKTPEAENRLNKEDLVKIKDEMQSFSKSFTPGKFNSTYNFKYLLEGSILQYAGVTGKTTTPTAFTVEDMKEEGFSLENYTSGDSVTYGNQTISKAQSDGIIIYAEDGYEGRAIENITAEDFDRNSYHKTDLKTKDPVSTGDDIYTIITDERWSLLIPLTDKQAVKLADRTTIRVKFLKDDMTQTGDFEVVKIDGGKYGKIDFNKGLIRYASDRFLDIELVTNNVTGLKIPLTSIVTKEFFTLPSTFATTNEETGAVSFLVAERGENGKTETKVVSPTVYATFRNPKTKITTGEETPEEDTYTYYVDMTTFNAGDEIVKRDSKAKYVVGEKAALEGVYCINQGYAVFRRIEILDQNEEYAIISRNTAYGLIRYDHIVRNADKVKEEDILY